MIRYRHTLFSIALVAQLFSNLTGVAQLIRSEAFSAPLEIEVGDLFHNESIYDIFQQDNGLIWVLGRKELYYVVNEGVYKFEEIANPVGRNHRFLFGSDKGQLTYFTTNAIVQLHDLITLPKTVDLTDILGLNDRKEIREVEIESENTFLIITGVDEKRELWRFDLERQYAELLSNDIGRMWDMVRIGEKWILTGKGVTVLTHQGDELKVSKKNVSHLWPEAQRRLDIIYFDEHRVYLKSGDDRLLVYDIEADTTTSFVTDEKIIDLWRGSSGEIRILLENQQIIDDSGQVLLDLDPSKSDRGDRPSLKITPESIAVQIGNDTWISCTQGFYQVNDVQRGFDVFHLGDETERVTNVHVDSTRNRVYILTSSQGLFIYEHSTGELVTHLMEDPRGNPIHGFKWKFLSNHLYLYSLYGLLELDKTTETLDFLVDPFDVDETTLPNRLNTFEVHPDLSQIFLGTKDGHLIRYDPASGHEWLYPLPKDSAAGRNLVYELDVLPDGDLIILAELGFYTYSVSEERLLQAEKRWSEIPAQTTPQLSGARVITDSTLLISSFGNGLMVFDFIRDSLYRPSVDAFSTADISDIFYDDVNHVYGCTRQGIISYHIPSNTTKLINSDCGLPVNNIHYRYMYSDSPGQMYLGLNKSFVSFDSEAINTQTKDNFLVKSIEANGKRILFSNEQPKEIELDYYQNNVQIDIVSSISTGIAPLAFQSRLTGLHDDWRTTSIGEPLHYDALAPGTYAFETRANQYGDVSLHIPFKVSRPYWEKPWFILSILALISAVILLILKLRSNYLRKEAELKSLHAIELAQLEMTSLRAQMNPHFLFNSLNSIKSFIAQNEPRIATRYLTKFSHLIRAILNNSRESSVSLDQELKALELYIELEQLRFEHSFSYHIKRPAGIDLQDIQVPPLILQPYVENAIWHGLLHKQGDRVLEVNLRLAQGAIVASIIDNGIGRLASQEIKSKSATTHKSLGMAITADRIRMVQQGSDELGIEIHDLLDEAGKARGTEVRIRVPMNGNKSI